MKASSNCGRKLHVVLTSSRSCAAALAGCLLVQAGFAWAAGAGRMTLDVLQPAYRNSIYATQTEQPIVVRPALDETSHARAVEMRGRLLDAQGRELAATKPGLKPGDEVRFDAKALPAGTYSVELRAFDAGGQELAAATAVIHKRPPSPGSEIRVDEHRNIVIDGRPSIQIGWYGAVRLDDPRPDVLALQNIQTAVVVNYPDKSPVTKLFREHGIRTMVNLEPARLLYAFDLWKQPGHPVPTEHTRLSAPSDECREMLRKIVELLKDEPGLFGWYIADEPEINNFRVDYLEAYYHTLRELDPYHPIIVTNDTLDGIEKIGFRCCDILAPDPYGAKPDYVPSFLAKAIRTGPDQRRAVRATAESRQREGRSAVVRHGSTRPQNRHVQSHGLPRPVPRSHQRRRDQGDDEHDAGGFRVAGKPTRPFAANQLS